MNSGASHKTKAAVRTTILIVAVTCVSVVGGTRLSAQTVPPHCNPKSPCPGSACQTAITSTSATQPADACPRFGENQFDVDVYSWNTFIALNWPADTAQCTANTQLSILSGQGPVVWETYPEDTDVFVPPGSNPGPWCSSASPAGLAKKLTRLPEATRTEASRLGVRKVFRQLGKASQVLIEKFPDISQAFNAGPLSDQNGRFVRYEKRLNQDEYNYLTTNNLWNAAGQRNATINFPQGARSLVCNNKPCGSIGAVEIKAAWKVLSATEIASNRFYTSLAWVFNDENGSPSPGKNPVTVGLVGLHILHKTQSEKTWFWSTFEQVDNTTSSFFNSGCTPAPCPTNVQTAKTPYTELTPQGAPVNAPVQVTRQIPIQADPTLNTYYQGLLRGSVWANYQLITTQWATGTVTQGTPTFVANTTLETFFGAQSSCMGCHAGAVTTNQQPADFSFLLGEAQ